jgi:hypothetical protein
MAEHGTVEYATAPGNDYPAHEQSYERFVQFTYVGILYVITILFALTAGGVMGHWFLEALILVIGVVGAVPSLISGSRTGIYAAFVLSLLIFAYATLSG